MSAPGETPAGGDLDWREWGETRVRTRYARAPDGSYLAYQVTGHGPTTLLVIFGPGLSVDDQLTGPYTGPFIKRLGRFARVVRVDRRGYGLSDPIAAVDATSWEYFLEDLVAALDATGTSQAAVFTADPTAAVVAMMLAAAHPRRVSHLVLLNPSARYLQAPDYPWGFTDAEADALIEQTVAAWVDDARPPNLRVPSVSDESAFFAWFNAARRRGMSPSMARAVYRNGIQTDIRSVLPAINVPTLVLRRGLGGNTRFARFSTIVIEGIPGARAVELPGDDTLAYVGQVDPLIDEVEAFVTGTRPTPLPDRVLATVMFTDISSSTERVAALGDHAWRELLGRFRAAVRDLLRQHRGREINTRGDDFLATFDGPARAIQCALAITDAAARLGVDVCTGLHTGEVELMGDDIGGIAVHIGARVAELATAGDVLVSRTVVDLVAGSTIAFTDRGEHDLRGVPGPWRLFAVNTS